MEQNDQNNQINKRYDLSERTVKFAEDIIKFCKIIPENTITKQIIIQLIKAGTSVGANYSEADDAESKMDFKHKIGICKKESREAKYWLKIINTACPLCKEKADMLWVEAKELNLIFNSINNKLKN